MSLETKIAAVADAIRAKTEETDLLTLPEMAAEISGKLSGNCFSAVITVAEDQTARFNAITGNALLAQHYDDTTLWAVFFNLDAATVQAGTYYRVFALTSNSVLAVRNTNENVYGYGGRTDGTTLNANISAGNNTLSSNSALIGVTSAGDLTLAANATSPVPEGSYLVAFGW